MVAVLRLYYRLRKFRLGFLLNVEGADIRPLGRFSISSDLIRRRLFPVHPLCPWGLTDQWEVKVRTFTSGSVRWGRYTSSLLGRHYLGRVNDWISTSMLPTKFCSENTKNLLCSLSLCQ